MTVMKKRLYVMMCLIAGSMAMSCSIDDIVEELEETFPEDCLSALSRMTQIQIQLDDPDLPDGEKEKLIDEFSKIESWAESNCGE